MIDTRIHTFLALCDRMNYRKTAEALHMTQPAVTQHVHYLEKLYGCKLFLYDGRTLTKTPQAAALERHARSMLCSEKRFAQLLSAPAALSLSIGATKTIGDYVLADKVLSLLKREDISLNLVIDNTENLLHKLNALELDLLLVEGYFDKNLYGFKAFRTEKLVGICAPEHLFAGKSVPLSALWNEKLILREEGSGTRAVFEAFLHKEGYSYESFPHRAQLSSFSLITKAVQAGCGISFVYESVAACQSPLGVFQIKGKPISNTFHYVFLQNTDISPYLSLLI